MKKLIILSTLAGYFLIVSSCASIVSRSKWPLSVKSNPPGAKITVTNKSNLEVYSGITPATFSLKSGAGFFGKQSYKIQFQAEGYEAHEIIVKCRINGWYFGNLLFGGLIGFLIVDPATGAMYKLDKKEVVGILSKTAVSLGDQQQLKIYSIHDIPENLKASLVKIN